MKKKISIIEKIRRWFIDREIKNYKLKDIDALMKQIVIVHKEATGVILKGEEKKLIELRIKRTTYFSKKMIEIISFVYNHYGPQDSMVVITSLINDYIVNTVKPEGRENFFDYLKGTVQGKSATDLKKLLSGQNDKEEEAKVRYIG